MLRKLIHAILGSRKHGSATPRLATGSAEQAAAMFESGRQALQDGDPEEAKSLLLLATELAPANGDAWFHLSAAHHAQGNLLDAGICCAHALEIDSQPQNWRDSLKNITTDLGAPTELEKWQKLADTHWIARLALGNTLRRLDHLDGAENEYRTALERSGGSPFAARRLACLLAISGRGDEADQYFLSCAAIGLKPDQVLRLSSAFFGELATNAAALQARLPDLQHLPLPTSREIVFLLSCDPAYFRKFAYAAANSIRNNCKATFAIHFHIVDPDDTIQSDVGRLRTALDLAEVNFTSEAAPAGEPWAKRTWYASARFARLPEIVRCYQKPVWLFDLDQLVVGDIVRCIAAAPIAPDIALVRWHATRWEPWEFFWASAVYATPSAQAFLDVAAAYVAHYLNAGKPVWFLDQIALFAAYVHTGNNGRMTFLDPAVVCIANPAVPLEPPPAAVFWSSINSEEKNAASLLHPVFLRYAENSAG